MLSVGYGAFTYKCFVCVYFVCVCVCVCVREFYRWTLNLQTERSYQAETLLEMDGQIRYLQDCAVSSPKKIEL